MSGFGRRGFLGLLFGVAVAPAAALARPVAAETVTIAHATPVAATFTADSELALTIDEYSERYLMPAMNALASQMVEQACA